MPVMDGYGQEVEVMESGFVADVDADITVCGLHVRRHVEHNIERPALPQNLHDELLVHRTDETSITAENTLRA